MSRGLNSDRPPNGQYVSALDSVMARLLTTEGDRRLKLKAVSGGANRHAVMWDMRDRRRQQTFTEAVDRFYRDVL
ncbi:hypothetical protein KBZ21_40270, partial [Streptomyces sp. A73]|nr:hypothetical protein [Streptomyces sp. A73]